MTKPVKYFDILGMKGVRYDGENKNELIDFLGIKEGWFLAKSGNSFFLYPGSHIDKISKNIKEQE